MAVASLLIPSSRVCSGLSANEIRSPFGGGT